MDEMMVVNVGQEAIKVALMLGLPILVTGMLVGVAVSILQVATSIQDMTITFIPKILSVFAVIAFGMHWMLRVITNFAQQIMHMVTTLTT